MFDAEQTSLTGEKTKVVHSLRGNFKEMLRDAGVSKEVNDFITGHGSEDVAGQYGSGPSLRVRQEAVERLNTRTFQQKRENGKSRLKNLPSVEDQCKSAVAREDLR